MQTLITASRLAITMIADDITIVLSHLKRLEEMMFSRRRGRHLDAKCFAYLTHLLCYLFRSFSGCSNIMS